MKSIHSLRQQAGKFAAMILAALSVLLPVSCIKDSRTPDNISLKDYVPLPGYEEMELGEKVQDPYSLDCMQKAMTSLGFDAVLPATHVYVRFLPESAEELKVLYSLGVPLFDHPLDHIVVKDGDYYKDPSLKESAYTWMYAVLEKSAHLPSGIRSEKLYDCFISPGMTSSGTTPSWETLSRESFRQAGLSVKSRYGGGIIPEGRLIFGKGYPVAGAKIVMNCFTIVASDVTGDDGSFSSDVSFMGHVRYRLDFTDGSYSLGMTESKSTVSSHSLGTDLLSSSGDIVIPELTDRRTLVRLAASAAICDYRELAGNEKLDDAALPENFSLMLCQGLDSGGEALMYSRCSVIPEELLDEYLPGGSAYAEAYVPDAVLGEEVGEEFESIYAYVSGITATVGLYDVIGRTAWGRSVSSRLSADLYGGQASDYGRSDQVMRMWASLVSSVMCKERFGKDVPLEDKPDFNPGILSDLMEKGASLRDILSAIDYRTVTQEDLLSSLEKAGIL